MRLHRLLLKDFRGVDEREVVFPDCAVVVVEGANEVGKSTMIEAFDLLLEEKDSSAKAAVRAVRPVGRDVGSTVEAELTCGPYRFVYRKTWNTGPGTSLTILRPTRQQLTGARAHERVREILAETTDVRLFRALRLLQAEPVQAERLGESGSLIAALDRAAGTAGQVAAGEPLIDAVQQEYLRYFTPTGRLTGDHAATAAEVQRADQAVAAAEAAVGEVTDDLAAHEQLTAELAVYQSELDTAESRLGVLRAKVAGLAALRERWETAATTAKRAGEAADRAAGDHSRRQLLIDDLGRREAELAKTLRRIEQVEVGAVRGGQQLIDLQAAAAAAGQEAARAADDAVRARADADHLQDIADHHRLLEQLTAIAAARTELAQATADLAGLRVDEAGLRAVEAAQRDYDLAVADRAAAVGRIELTGLSTQTIRLDGDELVLAAGSMLDRAVEQPTELELPGQLRLRVLPAGDAAALVERVGRCGADLAAALAAVESADLAAARSGHRRFLAAVVRRDRAVAQLAASQADAATFGSADETERRDRATALADDIAGYLAGRPADLPLSQSVTVAREQRRAADLADRTARERATLAARAVQAEQDRQRAEQLELARLRSSVGVQEAELAAARRALAAARQTIADDLLIGAVAAATRRAEESAEESDRLRAELSGADADGAAAAVVNAERSAARLRGEVKRLSEAVISVRARLEAYGSQGRQETLDQALSERSAATRRQTAVRTRAQAAALLREVVVRHRDEAKASYVAPFTDALNRLGRTVFGPSFEVEVDADLRVVARTLDGRTLPFQALSTGAREQLAILTRLAAAGVVAADGGVPVFIDDALGFSDPERLERIGAAFGSVSAAQIVLLTCTPDRYQAIPGAQVLRLVGAVGDRKDAAVPRRRTRRPPTVTQPGEDTLFEMGA